MTFPTSTRTVSAATRPALNHLLAFWETRHWRRTGRPSVSSVGRRRGAIWSQEMELVEPELAAAEAQRGARHTVVWFD